MMITEIIATSAAATAASKIKEDSLLGMLYKDTLQSSVQILGNALGSTIEFCTTPLLLCKFGSEKAKLNFKKRLDNYSKKIESIPEHQALPVNPQIGIPIIDRLTYTTNDELAELFVNLLAKASSSNNVNLAHPAFIKIIDSLTPDEALILKSFKGKKELAFVGLNGTTATKTYSILRQIDTGLEFDKGLSFPLNAKVYLNNLLSLGLVVKREDLWLSEASIYDDLFLKHNYAVIEGFARTSHGYIDTNRIKGMFKVSEFGSAFIAACIDTNNVDLITS